MEKKRVTLIFTVLFLFLLFLAGCRNSEIDGEIPQQILKMAEDAVMRHQAEIENQGIFYIEPVRQQEVVLKPKIGESKVTELVFSEKIDVTERMQDTEGFEDVRKAEVLLYDFSYELFPELSAELEEASDAGAVTLSEEGSFVYDDLLLAVLCLEEERYIELTENVWQKTAYAEDADYYLDRNLGSSFEKVILKTNQKYVLRMEETQIGLGLADLQGSAALPLNFDFSETVRKDSALENREVFAPYQVFSSEKGDFAGHFIEYYDFNKPGFYTVCVYLCDTGGFGETAEGIKVGMSRYEFSKTYRGGAMLRFDMLDEEGLFENDYIYAEIEPLGEMLFQGRFFYFKEDMVSAIVMKIMTEKEIEALDIYGAGNGQKSDETEEYESISEGDGYAVKPAGSEPDCKVVKTGYETYRRVSNDSEMIVFDLSVPAFDKALSGAAIVNAAIQKDFSPLIAEAEKKRPASGQTGFVSPVYQVFYEEYQLGDVYEICVFSYTYSALGSGVHDAVCRYVYDAALGRLLTDEEFLAFLQYDKAFIIEQFRKTAENLGLDIASFSYDDVKPYYYIDENYRVQTMNGLFSQ